MYAEHLSIDDGGEGKEIEDLAAGLPYRSVAVFGLTFLVETVDLGDLSRLVVSADESDAVRESISISTVNVVLCAS